MCIRDRQVVDPKRRSLAGRLVAINVILRVDYFTSLYRSSANRVRRSDIYDVIPLNSTEMMNVKTVHLLPCSCGTSLRVPRGRVGVLFNCENCGTAHRIESLAVLEALPAMQVSTEKKTNFSFSISALAKLTALTGVMCFTWLKLPAVATLVYTLAFAAVVYLLAVAIVGALLLSIPRLARAFWDRFPNNGK